MRASLAIAAATGIDQSSISRWQRGTNTLVLKAGKIVSGSASTWRRSISSTVAFPLGKDCGGSRNGYCWGGFWIYTSASKA
jgi:hypothetical protein